MSKGILGIGFTMRAGLVLILYDSFMDRPADHTPFRVSTSQKLSMVKKAGGYIVCVNPPEEEFTITIESHLFYPVSLKFGPLGKQGPCVIQKIRLIPGPGYPAPAGAVAVEGCAVPGSTVFFACEAREQAFKLLRDYRRPEGGKISIYHGENVEPEGKRLWIVSAQVPEGEILLVGPAAGGENAFLLETPLSHDYEKTGTSLYPVYEGRAGKDGYYRVLLKDVPCRCLGWNPTGLGAGVKKEFMLERKKGARVDFGK